MLRNTFRVIKLFSKMGSARNVGYECTSGGRQQFAEFLENDSSHM